MHQIDIKPSYPLYKMKKFLLVAIAVGMSTLVIRAQSESNDLQKLQVKIEYLETVNRTLSDQIKLTNRKLYSFEKKIAASNDSIKNLKSAMQQTNRNIKTISDTLGLKIEQNSEQVKSDFSKVNTSITASTMFWIIAVFAIALLSIGLFSWLRKKLSKEKSDLSDHIKRSSDALRTEQMNLDQQLITLLDKQMRLMAEKVKIEQDKLETADHSLALKVADEIVRIQKNLSNMDVETKGLKQLVASIKRIQDNFEANGYELVEMLNIPYNQGMKVTVNFRPDESLKPGEQIITRIIKPQVNFKGIMIQAAQVEVSVGE